MLVVCLIHANRVVARPLAIAQTLAKRLRALMKRSSNRHIISFARRDRNYRCEAKQQQGDLCPTPAASKMTNLARLSHHLATVAEFHCMSQHYDAIVIGGGHNGLVNAAYLAKAGKKVLVLERRHVLGGAAVTEEIVPGFLFSECSYVVSLLRPEIIRELDLPRHGLEILPLDGTFTPMLDRNYLWRMNDHAKSIREIRRHSRVDAEAYDEFSKMMTPMCRFVKPMLSMVPPDPTTLNPRDLKQLHFLGQRFRDLSSDERYTLIQLMTMSSADFLDQWFETDVLKATMSASGIIGTFLGIRSPGTAYVLLHHYMGEIDGAFRSWGFSRGGTGAISNAIGAAAKEAGVEIRTEVAVNRILVKNGRAAGVALKSGEEISATVVSSSVDPHLTFEKFLQPSELPGDFLER